MVNAGAIVISSLIKVNRQTGTASCHSDESAHSVNHFPFSKVSATENPRRLLLWSQISEIFWTYSSLISATQNNRNHLLETFIWCALWVFSLARTICLHGGGGVYDLSCSQPPGVNGDVLAGDVLASLLGNCHFVHFKYSPCFLLLLHHIFDTYIVHFNPFIWQLQLFYRYSLLIHNINQLINNDKLL